MNNKSELQKFENYFPRFSNQCNEKISQLGVNLVDDVGMKVICLIVQEELIKLIEINDTERLNQMCTLLLEDIIELKGKLRDRKQIVNCNFLQIFLSMIPIEFGIGTRMMQITFDWIVYSISDQVPYKTITEYKIERFAECQAYACDFAKNMVSSILIDWLGCLFYYSFSTGGLSALAMQFSEACINTIKRWYHMVSKQIITIDSKMVEMIIHFSSLMFTEDKEKCKVAVGVLENLLTLKTTDDKMKNRIKQQLSCAPGKLSSKSTQQWADEVLQDSENICDDLNKINIIINSFNNDINKAIKGKEILIGSIRKYLSKNKFNMINPINYYIKSRTIRLLNIPIGVYIKHGHCKYANEVLSAWYEVPDLDRKLIYCLPNQTDGPLYAYENNPMISIKKTKEEFRSIVEITNDFLCRNIAIAGDSEYEIQPYERPGVPYIELSEKFELELCKYYMLEQISIYKNEIQNNSEAMIVIPNLQHPLQPIMLKYAGLCLPTTVSLKKPCADRKIKKVLLWGAGSITSQFELDAIKKIFYKTGIEVDSFGLDDMTKERFKEKYSSNIYDVIWVISHGNYDQYNPHLSNISVSENDSPLVIEELCDFISKNSERRLLVLNVCDGGTSAAYGNPSDFGISPLVTSEYQATISHMWPTDPWFAAMFGVLLSIGLVNSNSFFEGFMYALAKLQSNKSEVFSELEKYLDYSDAIIQRLDNRELDFAKIFYWGSPVFYE